jgi:hypothetical protein
MERPGRQTGEDVMPEMAPSTPTRQAASWGLPVALVLLILALVAVYVRTAPPPPKPESAPPSEFSAGRARAVLAEIVGDGRPHPVGSAADAAVRERMLGILRRLGYAPRVESGYGCIPGGCGPVQNVVAELPGREPGNAVLVAAHYDSVSAGPGVSDDLSGIASILEVARSLKAGPQPRNSVIFLLDEGEEAGLLGARSFESAAEAPRVKAAVNLDARGTSGPSLMFETGPANAWLLPLFKVPHPVTSSVFLTLYEILPNDTDFSVFEKHGISGFNFAFLDGAPRYHTSFDDLAHISSASLQHQGDNALATVQALAGADLSRPHQGKAVFFDLLGFAVLWWPVGLGLLLGGLALLLLIVAAVRLQRAGRFTGSALALGFFAVPIVLLAAVLTAAMFGWVLRLLGPGLRTPWPARAFPGIITFWMLALAVTAIVANRLRRVPFSALWTGIWLFWSVVGLALALSLPGMSYLFLAPALVAGILGLALPGGEAAAALAAAVPAAVAGLLWFPILLLIYIGLGTSPGLLVIAALLAVLLTAIVPLLAEAGAGWRQGLPFFAIVLALVMAVGVVLSPVYSTESPQRMNVVYQLDGDTGQARFLVVTPPPLSPTMRKAADFARRPGLAYPWSNMPSFLAPAPALPLAAPQLAVLGETAEGGKRHVRLRLTSSRGAYSAIIAIPKAAQAEAISVAGHEVPPLPKTGPQHQLPGEYRLLALSALPAEGIEIDVVLGTPEHAEWTVLDRSLGVPPPGAALVAARPATAAPIQDGDLTVVSRKVRI